MSQTIWLFIHLNMRSQKTRSFSRDALIAIAAAVLTSAISYYTFLKQHNTDEKFRLNQNLNKLLDLDLQYPFLENSVFITRWDKNKDSNNDSSLRYQYYCIYVFNFLQDVCEYYDYDKEDMAKFMDISDLIGIHKSWWKLPENQASQAYDPKFKKFVDEFYKQ